MKRRTLPALWLALFAGAGCGGEATGPGGITISDIAATWNASQLLFTGISTSVQEDPIADGGSSVLTIQASGQFTFSIDFVDGSSLSDSGSLEFDSENQDFLLVLFDGETVAEAYFFQLNGNAMSLNGLTEFDFDRDGTDEAASLIAAFLR
ncbi:MAG: hypothetical protein V3U67_01330 [Gemmatimonadota bacterium]